MDGVLVSAQSQVTESVGGFKEWDGPESFGVDRMRLVKVAAAVLNQTPLDWEGNARRIRAAIASAREQRATVLCLPELCITGYGCEDAFHAS